MLTANVAGTAESSTETTDVTAAENSDGGVNEQTSDATHSSEASSTYSHTTYCLVSVLVACWVCVDSSASFGKCQLF